MRQFHPHTLKKGAHVLDFFGGMTCGGLRVILSTCKKVAFYISVEIDDVSRAITREVLRKLQEEYPNQLLDSAIKGYAKRLPQDIRWVDEGELTTLT